MKHEPNFFEIVVSTIVVVFSVLGAAFIVDWLFPGYSLMAKCFTGMIFFITILKIVEMFLNILYMRWQARKHVRK